MRMAATLLLLLVPMITAAQDYQGMSEEDMEKMMQAMQKMESCMENVDQSKLKILEQRSHEVETEIESLCADGKRDEAQNKALSFGREIAQDPTMKDMRKCGEAMKGMMPKMPFTDQNQDQDRSVRHVCD